MLTICFPYNHAAHSQLQILRVHYIPLKTRQGPLSAGYDSILNEYIKSTRFVLLPVYELLFNRILDTGYFPEQWSVGTIKPIYKNKGSTSEAANYRPITILSCLGKLFTSILNDRLNTFLEDALLLSENQAGFRKQYSTLDHIFSLNAIIEIIQHRKKKLFC